MNVLREWVIKMVPYLTLKHSREAIAEWFGGIRLVGRVSKPIHPVSAPNREYVCFDVDKNAEYTDDLAKNILESNTDFITSCVGMFDNDEPSTGVAVAGSADDSVDPGVDKVNKSYIFGSDSNHGFTVNSGLNR